MSLSLFQIDCKRAVEKLKHLNNQELDEIVNNDERIEEILQNLDQSFLKNIQEEKEQILSSNRTLAEENLNREPELVEGREKLLELSQEAEELTKKIEEKLKEIRNKNGDMSLETALALLQTAASEIEEESERFAKKFLQNEIELYEFLDKFLEKRKLMHLRLVKAEKMAKILSRNPSGIGNYINTPPLNLNTNYFPGVPNPSSVPYPTGPINMPFPPMPNYFQNHF